MKHNTMSIQTMSSFFYFIVSQCLFWYAVTAAQEATIPETPLCCLIDGRRVSDMMWKHVLPEKVEQLTAYTRHFPPMPLDDGVTFLTGIGGRDAVLQSVWVDAHSSLVSLILSDEPDSKKEEELKAFKQNYRTRFRNKRRFDELYSFLTSLVLDDKLIWDRWAPDDNKQTGLYESYRKYYNQEQRQERTLFHAVTIIKTSLENILKAYKNFSEYPSEQLKRRFLEISIVPDVLYRGEDHTGHPVEMYHVQFTQDVEKVGLRTYRLSYCDHFVKDEATQQYYLRSDAQRVSIAQTAPSELERVKRRYGEEAGEEFAHLYGSYLYLPLDGTERDTAYCVVNYLDVNPRKAGENTWIARGDKQKVVRTNLADIKMRAERLGRSESR
jgi:hypothetical protein